MEQPACVENVPPEIWSEVFLNARKTSIIEGTYNQTRFTRHDVPISVSQVCNRFRAIAINTPLLWTSIVLDLSSQNPVFSLSSTKLWLKRSKNSPLSIFVYHIKGSEMAKDSTKLDCCNTLLSHIGRWREAALEWADTDTDFWPGLSTGLAGHAPLLQSLVLRPTVDEDVAKKGLLPSMLWVKSPLLRKFAISLSVIPNDFYLHPPNEDECSTWTITHSIPYKQLTHLHLHASDREIISRKEVLSIFIDSPNLVCCFFDGISGDEPATIQAPFPLLVNNLRHLYLKPASYDNNHSFPTRILDYITTPSLLSLTYVNANTWISEPVADFIRRSSCPLEELNFIRIFMKLPEIHTCIKLISRSLRRLHVDSLRPSSTSGNDFIRSMTTWNPTTHEFQACPHLEQVSLFPLPFEFDHESHPFSSITQILASRLQPPSGGPKQFKTLLVPARYRQQISPELRLFCEDPTGLTISFNDNMLNRDSLWERFANQ